MRDESLKKNPDGSFTIYIQSESPGPDKKPNCCRRPSGASSILFRAPTLRHKLRSTSCPIRSRGRFPQQSW
ncbi:MAG: hypothetical protein WAL15_08865 [Xanthobacteraceae bacterium]